MIKQTKGIILGMQNGDTAGLCGAFCDKIMVKQAAQGGLAGDVRGMCGQIGIGIIQGNAVINALMGAMMIMMALDGLQYVPQMAFAEENELIQSGTRRSDKSFGVGVALRRMRRGFDDATGLSGNGGIERFEQGIAVMDKDRRMVFIRRQYADELFRLLFYP